MELRDYQKNISSRAAALLRECGICYLAMECRTGKTLTALACAQEYGAKNVLFVTKRMAKPSVENDYIMLAPNYNIEITTHDSVHKVSMSPDLVIIDEAHSIGSFPKPSARARMLKKICTKVVVLYMSGTPSPESYSQLYHQMWITPRSPWRRYSTFYKWAKEYVVVESKMRGGFQVNDYSNAIEEKVRKDIEHLCIDYTQDEAGFTANIIEEVLTVEMTKATEIALHLIERDRVLNPFGHYTLADTPAKLLSKMHQLSSGTVISDDGTHLITDRSKGFFIKEYFKGRKIAIFYVYKTELELLKEVFPNWTDEPESFQSSDDLVFLGQVRSAREGVRLDTADALIFYNMEYSYLSYEQGRNRLVSKERKEPARIYFLCSHCGIEKSIMEAVHDKKDFTMSYYSHKKSRLNLMHI